MVMEGDLTLGAEDTGQYTDDVFQNDIPETYMSFKNNVTLINLIKQTNKMETVNESHCQGRPEGKCKLRRISLLHVTLLRGRHSCSISYPRRAANDRESPTWAS